MKNFFRMHSLVIIFVAIVLLASFISKDFFTTDNFINILRQGSIIGLLTIGETLVILSGGIDLSVGSLVIFVSILGATFMSQGILFSVLLAIFLGTFFGLVNGLLVVKAKISPFIATLGTMLVARGLATVISGGKVVYGVTKSFRLIAQGNLKGVPIPILILSFAAIIILFFLRVTRWGIYIRAVGGSEEVACISGINLGKTKLLVYGLSGLFASFAGLIYLARVGAGYCEVAVGYELDAIASVVIGGVNLFGGEGSLVKALLGTYILAIICNFMNLTGISPYTQEAVRGIIILIAVYFNLKMRR